MTLRNRSRLKAHKAVTVPKAHKDPVDRVVLPPGGGGKTESSSNTTYDSLDTNRDGTVSEMERLVGELKEAVASLAGSDSTASDSTSSASRNSANDSKAGAAIADLAKHIYAQVAQGWSSGNINGGLLSASA